MANRIEEAPLPITLGSDVEKQGGVAFSAQPASFTQVDEKNADSDANSENFQAGVQRVRAVTDIWSRNTLWLMFGL